MKVQSRNFGFLNKTAPLLAELGALAERYFVDDPNTALIKMRQFGERLAQLIAADNGMFESDGENQCVLLNRLSAASVLPRQAEQLFHSIRRAGNRATHHHKGDHKEALQNLRYARELAVWYHRSFGGAHDFKPGPFAPPQPPEKADDKLAKELEALKAELNKALTAAEQAKLKAEEDAQQRLTAEERAKQAEEDRAVWESLVAEAEQRLNQQAEELAKHQEIAAEQPAAVLNKKLAQASKADDEIDLDEASTRHIIDDQLRIRGWEADSEKLKYAGGTRPHKSRNIAIAEWPTASGPVDYALFCGLTCVGVVEAKRSLKDVPGTLIQTKRYSRDFTQHEFEVPPGGPWGEYRVPFIFATNGRPFLRQLQTKSGIWFFDARRPNQPSRPLPDWYTPKGLLKLLQQDLDAANEKLKTEPLSYLNLRPYQNEAIQAVETALEAGQRECLLAMATGTGKTRTAIGLVYRLIKAGRFRRVLFLVDRTSLGDQAADAFKNVKLEQLKSFTEIYDVKELGDITPDDDTKLHISTIQGVMHRLLYAAEQEDTPSVDQYDCIIVDEAHRGYTLDRELSDTELTFRSEADYVSKYRRVIDYFDAAKVALTATPALHTTEIFGDPVFTYSYRDAVIDGHLIDHEPPYRIVTKLADEGIKFTAGEQVKALDPNKQKIDFVHLPDDLGFDVEGFNKNVITENFNKTVCAELARQIDPSFPGKTLIFCVNRDHADLVVTLLKEAFVEAYGGVDDDAVVRITGDIDKPREMIRRYKNEVNPKFAVTVDLLTTGIDVPEIVNLVFLRRVRSRILYDQMLGRATRLCPDIGKEYFRVFDCVDLYAGLLPITQMKPVVQDPSITFAQLFGELTSVEDEAAKQEVFDQLMAKLHTKLRRLYGTKLEAFVEQAQVDPAQLLKDLHAGGAAFAADWFEKHPGILVFLDTQTATDRPAILISEHDDEIKSVERGYGTAEKPEDYLAAFKKYLDEHLNDIPALLVVTQRPRELTREQLREIKRTLDQAGFNEATLRTAYRETTNQDIAATIIGYIRQQALGEPLIPYGQRIETAMQKIQSAHKWTNVQRTWLDRIAKQLQKETIVDRDAIDKGSFRDQGGFKRLNKVFEGNLEELLGDINQAMWEQSG